MTTCIKAVRIPQKDLCLIGYDSFELLSHCHYAGTAEITVSLLADRKNFMELDGDPLDITLMLANGNRVRGNGVRIDSLQWVTGRIVKMTLQGEPGSISRIPPATPNNPDFHLN